MFEFSSRKEMDVKIMKFKYKDSIVIVMLKLFEAIIGIGGLLYVTSNMDPVIYSLIGLKSIFDSIMMLIPNIGFENVFIRNYLHWDKNSMKERIDYQYSIAIKSKLLLGLIIMVLPISLSFFYYISKYNYDEFYLLVLIYYVVSSYIITIGNTYKLIIMGTGNYLSLNIGSFLLVSLYKLVLIFFYKDIGAYIYLFLMPLGELFLLLYLYLFIRKKYNFKYIRISFIEILKQVKVLSNYIKENYTNFLTRHLDRLLVSIFLDSKVFATYSLVLQIEQIGRTALEAFFDPITQKTVRYKSDMKRLSASFKNINKIRFIITMGGIIGLLVYFFYGKTILDLFGFEKYPHLYEFCMFVLLNIIILTLFKVENNIIALFYDSKYRYHISVIGLVSILPFILISILPIKYVVIIRTISVVMIMSGILYIYYSTGGIKSEKNIYSDV